MKHFLACSAVLLGLAGCSDVVVIPPFVLVGGHVGPGGSSPRSNPDEGKFIPEELARYVEAPEKFPRHVLPSIAAKSTSKHVYWVDTAHVILAVRELPSGWQATRDEPSRIVIINANTGEIELTPYRGDLLCYSSQRMVTRGVQNNPGDGEVTLAGKLGEQLQPLQWKISDPFRLIEAGCQLVSTREEGYYNYRLFEWDKVLRVSRPYDEPLKDGTTRSIGYGSKIRLENSSGQLVTEMRGNSETAPGTHLVFLPFRNQYFAGRYLYNPDGSRVKLEDPRVIQGAPWPMRAGLLWQANYSGAYWTRRGLYWQDGDREMVHDDDIISRVDDAAVTNVAVSPDGCRVYYKRSPGDPTGSSLFRKSPEAVVMDVCRGP
jgi:hypothetical protein